MNKIFKKYKHLVFTIFIGLFSLADTSGQICTVVSEVSVEAVAAGSLIGCSQSGHPLLCSVATALMDTGLKQQSKQIVKLGCTIITKIDGDQIVATVKGSKEKIEELYKEMQDHDVLRNVMFRMTH